MCGFASGATALGALERGAVCDFASAATAFGGSGGGAVCGFASGAIACVSPAALCSGGSAPESRRSSSISVAVIPCLAETKTLRQMPFTDEISCGSSSTRQASSADNDSLDIKLWMRLALDSRNSQSELPSSGDDS